MADQPVQVRFVYPSSCARAFDSLNEAETENIGSALDETKQPVIMATKSKAFGHNEAASHWGNTIKGVCVTDPRNCPHSKFENLSAIHQQIVELSWCGGLGRVNLVAIVHLAGIQRATTHRWQNTIQRVVPDRYMRLGAVLVF